MTDVKVKEAEQQIKTLSLQALDIAENRDNKYATAADQKAALDKIEPDIKKWEDEHATLLELEDARKRFAGLSSKSGRSDGIENLGDDKGGEGKAVKSVGQQFAESKGYKDLLERGLKGGSWSSGDIDIKSPLTEGTAGVPGGGYQLPNATPQLVPGILPILFRQLVVADLFPSGTTDSPLIRYLVETMATNGAAATAEGGLKPESAIAFDKVDETLHKIATFLPVSDEMLEDYSQIQSYIDARLGLFIKLQEEAQLLSGDGTGSNVVGLLNRSGLAPSIAKGTSPSAAGDNDMDAIYRQITAIRMAQFVEPDSIVIDPLGWENVLLAKAPGTGNYYANGPFADAQVPRLWGKPVAVSSSMASQTALVGAFQTCAQIFRKGGLTVEASNSHADYFQRDLTAIRAEERIALAVYRPGAFGTVTNIA